MLDLEEAFPTALKVYSKESGVMVEKAISWESGHQGSGLSSDAH